MSDCLKISNRFGSDHFVTVFTGRCYHSDDGSLQPIGREQDVGALLQICLNLETRQSRRVREDQRGKEPNESGKFHLN